MFGKFLGQFRDIFEQVKGQFWDIFLDPNNLKKYNRHLLLINTPHAQNFGQNFGQIFDQIFGQVFDQGFLDRKYSVQFYWDREIQYNNTIYYLLFNP